MQQQKLVQNNLKIRFAAVAALILSGLVFGFGYFWGRYDQIQINKSIMETIPDVNCTVPENSL